MVHQVPVVIQAGAVHEVVGSTWLDHNAVDVRNIWIEPTPTGSVLVAAAGHHEKAGDWEFRESFQNVNAVRDWLAKERFANAHIIDMCAMRGR